MKAEYEKLIRALRIEFSVEIKEADANTDKWYELYVDKGVEIGTHTVCSASTFDEVIVHFEKYAEQYGISNTHIDIMRQPDDAETTWEVVASGKQPRKRSSVVSMKQCSVVTRKCLNLKTTKSFSTMSFVSMISTIRTTNSIV